MAELKNSFPPEPALNMGLVNMANIAAVARAWSVDSVSCGYMLWCADLVALPPAALLLLSCRLISSRTVC